MNSDELRIIEEVEQSLLGILLAYPERADDVIGVLLPEYFLWELHGDIFREIMNAHQSDQLISPIHIGKKFIGRDDLPEYYLPDLASSVCSPVNLNSYIQTVSNAFEKRQFLQKIEEINITARTMHDVSDLKTDLLSYLENKKEATVFSRDKKQAMIEVVSALNNPKPCHRTGIPILDQSMGGGLFEGFTYGFAGAEKSGKTTTAQTISYNLNMLGVKHAYIAMEMGSSQIEQRNIARYIGVNSLKFLEKPTQEFISSVSKAVSEMPNNTIYSDMAGASFDQIKSELHKLVRHEKIKGFFLDYWQLVGGMDSKSNRSDFLFDIAQWCAAFSRKNKIFCVILSQLNRRGELLGSAGIERACDQLYVINSPEGHSYKAVNMRLTHSRYTHVADLGSDEAPCFEIDYKAGPHLRQI